MRQHVQVILAALLVLILGFVGYSLIFDSGESAVLTIVDASGDVRRVDAAGRPLSAEAGAEVRAQERVATGADGRVVLAIDEQSQIRLDQASSVRVLGVDAAGVRVELEGGRVQARVRAGSPELGLISRGRSVVASDADFAMGVDDEGALTVDAERGDLGLRGFDGVDALGDGDRLRAMPGRSPVVSEVPSSLLLNVAWPEVETTRNGEVEFGGRTEPYAVVTLVDGDDGRRIRAGPDGRFEATVPLEEGDNLIRVRVSDPMGNSEEAEHAIRRDSTAPSVTSSEVDWGR